MSAAPGWYPDTTKAGTQRYWDGEAWTDHMAPLAAPAAPQSTSSALLTIGWLSAIFLPIVGFVLGIVIADKHREGGWIIGLSLVSGIFWFWLWASMSSPYSVDF